MTHERSFFTRILWVPISVSLTLSAAAQNVIYDNSVNDTTNRFSAPPPAGHGNEFGDEINVIGGVGQYLSRFSFEFYGTNGLGGGGAFSGTVTAQVRFYEMTGPPTNGYPTPALIPFFESTAFTVPTTDVDGRATFLFSSGLDWANGGLFLPATNITWSVQFSGLLEADDVGVDIYDPVTVGQNFPDYWERNVFGDWELKTNVVNMNFAARFETPEPSSVALFVLGGLGLFYASQRRRKPQPQT